MFAATTFLILLPLAAPAPGAPCEDQAKVRYKGTGSTDAAENFGCVDATKK